MIYVSTIVRNIKKISNIIFYICRYSIEINLKFFEMSFYFGCAQVNYYIIIYLWHLSLYTQNTSPETPPNPQSPHHYNSLHQAQ